MPANVSKNKISWIFTFSKFCNHCFIRQFLKFKMTLKAKMRMNIGIERDKLNKIELGFVKIKRMRKKNNEDKRNEKKPWNRMMKEW